MKRIEALCLLCVCFEQTIAKDMVKRGEGGVIVNVSSMASRVALKEHTCYCKM